MKTINLSNKQLDSIDLSEFDRYLNQKYRKTHSAGGYGFYDKSGVEQYKLLAYMSTLLDNETILDVGTFEGGSALALSKNKTNNVVSIDVNYQVNQNIDLDNILFLEGDILNDKEEIIEIDRNFRSGSLPKNYGKDLIDKSKLILYDTVHDGVVETQFHNYLVESNWSGICIWDDIKFRANGNIRTGMVDFWDSIENEKEDVTKYAHWTGTGMVWYNQDKDINLK
tara:strand:+ start:679 stop:1353 length:675 start_codon:yes stop_codon:yes gene_type:complete